MGLDYELLVNPDDVSPNLLCPLCRLVFRDPVFACDSPCQCTFCHDCIHTWLYQHTTCPVDRQQMKMKDLRPHVAMKSFIDELLVRCPRHAEGCCWTGRYDSVNGHDETCVAKQACGLRHLLSQRDKEKDELNAEISEKNEIVAKLRASMDSMEDKDKTIAKQGHRNAKLKVRSVKRMNRQKMARRARKEYDTDYDKDNELAESDQHDDEEEYTQHHDASRIASDLGPKDIEFVMYQVVVASLRACNSTMSIMSLASYER